MVAPGLFLVYFGLFLVAFLLSNLGIRPSSYSFRQKAFAAHLPAYLLPTKAQVENLRIHLPA